MDTSKTEDTAAWMAGCRASQPEISLDIFANLWLDDPAREKYKEYVTEVSPTEDICLSLRNRFFLKCIGEYLSNYANGTFINLGAGFSSLSWLLPANHNYIEIDCQNNIRTKRRLVDQLVTRGQLPERNLQFISCDLSDLEQINILIKKLHRLINHKKCFLLMEGLLYYLPTSANALLKLADEILFPGSQLGVVTWDPGTFNYPVFKRFCQFMQEKGRPVPKFVYHDPVQIASRARYKLVRQTNYKELSGFSLKSRDDVFWETLTILTKEQK